MRTSVIDHPLAAHKLTVLRDARTDSPTFRRLPTAEVGFLGIVRDEDSLTASTYATRLPDDLSDREVFVLDPAPEGIARVDEAFADDAGCPVTVVTAGVDERLDGRGYITPGLGDAGDRLYGAV